jgi:hypothetical protein
MVWRTWRELGEQNIRIYKITETDGEFENEDCIASIGGWPQ